ncbi:hypothetical protein H312_01396 [Anncaliia algerae PRA339]|uniref:PIN domain-containing protein n=1 Tax=Anncaliia algerae PRA339 TaxID=1288291 RepID=A0A059F2K5_9MICR|nr:hypothetical protein H312_01396 [Anncaliia algerae PRA339]
MGKKIKPKRVKAFFNKPKKPTTPEEQKQEEESFLNALSYKLKNNIKPPYFVMLDTNFINFAIKKKMDIKRNLMSCLLSNSKLFVTECVIAELEKLGRAYRVALGIVKRDDFNRLQCDHKGTYADDCIVNRITASRCYIVATCDTELKNRIRKVGGVPIVSIMGRKFDVEGL